MTGAQRSPEELSRDLRELRAEVGDTVEELAHRVDVPARARAKKDETVERVRQQVARTRAVAADKAPAVRSSLRDTRVVAGGAALAVVVVLIPVLRRRSRR
jgi:Protein of unknown function (DUF3618)